MVNQNYSKIKNYIIEIVYFIHLIEFDQWFCPKIHRCIHLCILGLFAFLCVLSYLLQLILVICSNIIEQNNSSIGGEQNEWY